MTSIWDYELPITDPNIPQWRRDIINRAIDVRNERLLADLKDKVALQRKGQDQ